MSKTLEGCCTAALVDGTILYEATLNSWHHYIDIQLNHHTIRPSCRHMHYYDFVVALIVNAAIPLVVIPHWRAPVTPPKIEPFKQLAMKNTGTELKCGSQSACCTEGPARDLGRKDLADLLRFRGPFPFIYDTTFLFCFTRK
jgi:hypothetical protein